MYYSRYDLETIATRLIALMQSGVSYDEAVLIYPDITKYANERANQIKSRKVALVKDQEKAKARIEKQKQEDAIRAEIVKKLTPEERKAFGLDDKGKKRIKR